MAEGWSRYSLRPSLTHQMETFSRGWGWGHPGELLLSSSMLTRMVTGCCFLTFIVIVLRGVSV